MAQCGYAGTRSCTPYSASKNDEMQRHGANQVVHAYPTSADNMRRTEPKPRRTEAEAGKCQHGLERQGPSNPEAYHLTFSVILRLGLPAFQESYTIILGSIFLFRACAPLTQNRSTEIFLLQGTLHEPLTLSVSKGLGRLAS